MFLSIYVHRRLGLTFDVTEDGTRLPEETARHGPAFDRLTADPDMLRHAVRLRRWLAALLPENNTLAAYRLQAREAWERHGAGAAPDSAAAVLWGNADAEYAGAIELRRIGPDAPPELDAPAAGAVEPLTDAEIGRRLGLAARVAEEPQVHVMLIGRRFKPIDPVPDDVHHGLFRELLALSGRRAALSGMRGKFGATPLPGGRWGTVTGAGLNTWIVKHEHRDHLPGEAGVEAICQRTLALVGVPAATTRARVFGGQQAVLSERSDRVRGPDGRVDARHQEEFVQALGHDPEAKYWEGRRGEPGWPAAYQLLQRHGASPERCQNRLTRALAACWLLGNGDLHRRNLGFLHTPAGAPAGVTLAPLYDASSAIGTRYASSPDVPIGGGRRRHRITPRHWLRPSRDCGIDGDRTLAIIDELFRTLPDALAAARDQARDEDENLFPLAVAERIDATIGHVQARERAYRQQAVSLGRRGRDRD
ncbi:MAG: type II toxin-antitoxin system HipA family toxin [Chloroflexi bacterium]|nr:type II toxin-antitoxin system HipA family toxin [Chloroflexota bacterium]